MIDRAIINQPHKPFDFPNDYKDTSFWLYKLIKGNLNPLAPLANDTLEERLVEYNKTAKYPIKSMTEKTSDTDGVEDVSDHRK